MAPALYGTALPAPFHVQLCVLWSSPALAGSSDASGQHHDPAPPQKLRQVGLLGVPQHFVLGPVASPASAGPVQPWHTLLCTGARGFPLGDGAHEGIKSRLCCPSIAGPAPALLKPVPTLQPPAAGPASSPRTEGRWAQTPHRARLWAVRVLCSIVCHSHSPQAAADDRSQTSAQPVLSHKCPPAFWCAQPSVRQPRIPLRHHNLTV